MSKKLLLIACLPFLLPACQNISSTPQPHSIQKTMNESQTLRNYNWMYSGSEATLNLQFNQNSLYIQTDCNGQNTQWELDQHILKTNHLISTMKMCSAEQMKKEQFAQQLFDHTELKVQIDNSKAEQPILNIETTTGQKYQFVGTMTPEFKYKAQPQTVFFEIAPQQQPCTSNPSQQCLQVRQIKYSDSGVKTYVDSSWKQLPVEIQGYNHDPKSNRIIRVKAFNTDSKQPAYIYDMTVEQSN